MTNLRLFPTKTTLFIYSSCFFLYLLLCYLLITIITGLPCVFKKALVEIKYIFLNSQFIHMQLMSNNP